MMLMIPYGSVTEWSVTAALIMPVKKFSIVGSASVIYLSAEDR